MRARAIRPRRISKTVGLNELDELSRAESIYRIFRSAGLSPLQVSEAIRLYRRCVAKRVLTGIYHRNRIGGIVRAVKYGLAGNSAHGLRMRRIYAGQQRQAKSQGRAMEGLKRWHREQREQKARAAAATGPGAGQDANRQAPLPPSPQKVGGRNP